MFVLSTHSNVLWLIITGTGSGVASEFFILHLSVSETGNCLNNLIDVLTLVFMSINIKSDFNRTLTGSPLYRCVICVERYLAVVHPVTFLKYKLLRYKVICCWIIIISFCLCCMFTIDSNTTVYLWSFSVQFLLILSIQLFCFLVVLRALMQSAPGERGRKSNEENHMKRRAFHLILITTVDMVILHVPIIISTLFTNLA